MITFSDGIADRLRAGIGKASADGVRNVTT